MLAFSGNSTRSQPRGEDIMRHPSRVSNCVASRASDSCPSSQQAAISALMMALSRSHMVCTRELEHESVTSPPTAVPREPSLAMVLHGGQRPELATALEVLKQVVRATERSCTRVAVHAYVRSACAHGRRLDKTGQR